MSLKSALKCSAFVVDVLTTSFLIVRPVLCIPECSSAVEIVIPIYAVLIVSVVEERPGPMSFTLTHENRLHSFMIDIPSNDDTGPDERRYTLEIVSSAVGDLRVINPDKLTVLIKDNDTG